MGANNADFHGITFSHEFTPDKQALFVFANHPTHGILGVMEAYLSKKNNMFRIEGIDVHHDFRRKGIATGMWNHAVNSGINLVHSDERTDSGELWARKIGGPGHEISWSKDIPVKILQRGADKSDERDRKYGEPSVNWLIKHAKSQGINLDKPI